MPNAIPVRLLINIVVLRRVRYHRMFDAIFGKAKSSESDVNKRNRRSLVEPGASKELHRCTKKTSRFAIRVFSPSHSWSYRPLTHCQRYRGSQTSLRRSPVIDHVCGVLSRLSDI